MNGLLSILSGPIKGVLDGASSIIDKFVASPAEKFQAQQALLKLQMDFQTQLLQADGEFAAQQAAVIEGEEKSESWLARNWRPILMLTFTFIIWWNFIIAPVVHMPKTDIPPDMWELLKLGITGYIVGRSAEKLTPSLASVLTSSKK